MRKIAEFYRDTLPEYQKCAEEAATLTESLRARERQQSPSQVFRNLVNPASVMANAECAIVDCLVEGAAKQFAPPGPIPLEIDAGPWRRQAAESDFDPVKVWEALVETYGHGHGHAIVYQIAADKLVQALGLRRAESVKQVAGIVRLDCTVTIDCWRNIERLDVYSRERVYDICNGLATFAHWASLGDDAEQIASWGASWGQRGAFDEAAVVEAKARIRVAPWLEVRTYRHRFEFRFSPDVAAQLQVFVSEYSRYFRQEAA